MISIGIMFEGLNRFGINENTWLEPILDVFYVACTIMIWMYFFNYRITTEQFNYWCTICVGMTVFLRDILFYSEDFVCYPLRFVCLTFSVLLLCTLTYFYARKEWKSYNKSNLWFIFIVDAIIAALYHIEILLEPTSEFTEYYITEIWIRPCITYGLVTCFVSETSASSEAK